MSLRCFLAVFIAALLASAPCVSAEEMRAAWVASVFNINFPSKQGLSPEAQKAEISRIVQTARKLGLNALMVQVRPEGDALYESRVEPWSRFLTGTQGKSPGYDPLATFISEGQKNGVEIHAWINPYRAAANAKNARHPSHVTNRLSAHTKRVGNLLLLDPGSKAVQDHVVAVVKDLVSRYPLGGVHLDDYFYPYPSVGRLPDSDSYARYRSAGGALAIGDWRRQNVHRLIKRISDTMRSVRPSAKFGISPFGIYTKGEPADVKAGVDQLNELYADPLVWMKEGWIDYLAPQLYWREGGPQSFSSLLKWWRIPRVNPRQVPIYPGIAIERLGGSHNWPAAEIATQLKLERTIGPGAGAGFILWDFKPLKSNTKGIQEVIAGATR
jgi:uncharacterized lipoprotein YddW (UPF0748 family)